VAVRRVRGLDLTTRLRIDETRPDRMLWMLRIGETPFLLGPENTRRVRPRRIVPRFATDR
jgi:hypothetical protein